MPYQSSKFYVLKVVMSALWEDAGPSDYTVEEEKVDCDLYKGSVV